MTTNPTAEQFQALVAEDQAELEALQKVEDTPREAAAAERSKRAWNALLAARPTEPDAMAAQLRWLEDHPGITDEASVSGIQLHIAAQLEAMAGAVVLPPAAVAQIRAAIVTTLAEDFAAEPDPEPDDALHSTLDMPAILRLRAALRALDTAADQPVLDILAQLNPSERGVWLEMGRRMESGEAATDASNWADAEIQRLRADAATA